jgi:hypothetical protein
VGYNNILIVSTGRPLPPNFVDEGIGSVTNGRKDPEATNNNNGLANQQTKNANGSTTTGIRGRTKILGDQSVGSSEIHQHRKGFQ